jgi:hypothetical protein
MKELSLLTADADKEKLSLGLCESYSWPLGPEWWESYGQSQFHRWL